jgi:hypothetical protein
MSLALVTGLLAVAAAGLFHVSHFGPTEAVGMVCSAATQQVGTILHCSPATDEASAATPSDGATPELPSIEATLALPGLPAPTETTRFQLEQPTARPPYPSFPTPSSPAAPMSGGSLLGEPATEVAPFGGDDGGGLLAPTSPSFSAADRGTATPSPSPTPDMGYPGAARVPTKASSGYP